MISSCLTEGSFLSTSNILFLLSNFFTTVWTSLIFKFVIICFICFDISFILDLLSGNSRMSLIMSSWYFSKNVFAVL